MQLNEDYVLFALTLKQGKRELYVGGLNYHLRVTYKYNGKEINSKEISLERYFQFCDKYRGKKTKGFNRPSINTLEFDTKQKLFS